MGWVNARFRPAPSCGHPSRGGDLRSNRCVKALEFLILNLGSVASHYDNGEKHTVVMLQCGKLRFENVEAVIFDKDGTLADSRAFLKELAAVRSRHLENWVPGVFPQLMAAFGCSEDTYDPAGLMAVGTRYENEIAAATYVAAAGRSWGAALEIARTAFTESDRHFSRKAEHTPPLPDIPALIKSLYVHGLKLAVLSGDTTANVQDFVNCYGLQSWVGWCAGSERPPVKPDPLMLWNTCQKLGVFPEQSLVIGDSILDYQLARRGNAQAFISVTWGGSPAIADADVTLRSPRDLRVLPDRR